MSENDHDDVMDDIGETNNDPEPELDREEAEDEEDGEAGADAYADIDVEAEYEGAHDPEVESGSAASQKDLDIRTDSDLGIRTAVLHLGRRDNAASFSAQERDKEAKRTTAEDGTAVDSSNTIEAAMSRQLKLQRQASNTTTIRGDFQPQKEVLMARLYDIVPTIAAPQATSINALAVTPDLRFWMTGGSDGYIRKYDGPGTINGKQLLTVAQRHPFVDSVVKAGILMSYWENEEPPQTGGASNIATGGAGASAVIGAEHILSPVYSLAVHSRALWLLAGTEGGSINLQSVRHDEGKRIASLQGHSNAVSVLQLAPDEKSVVSGSWDKNIIDWDLNCGQERRRFEGSGGQVSAIELQPAYGAPISQQATEETVTVNRGDDNTLSSSNDRPPATGFSMNSHIYNIEGMDLESGAGTATLLGGSLAAIAGDDSIPDHESLFGSPGATLYDDGLGNNPFNDDTLSTAVDEFSQDVDIVLDAEGTSDVFVTSAFSVDLTRSGSKGVETGNSSLPNPNNSDIFSTQTTLNHDIQDSKAATMKASTGTNAHATLSQPSPIYQDVFNTDQNVQAKKEPQELPVTRLPALIYSSQRPPTEFDPTQVSDKTFLSASIDGTIRIWDRRRNLPVAIIGNRPGIPPWCMGACWSPDGNRIYAGRRNGIVEEFDIHHTCHGWQPERALRFPAGSGPVSAVRAMVNGRHLVCASHDILRLYDLHDTSAFKNSSVPFLIIPGPPRAGVISHLYIDQTSRYMISTAGTRGWEGTNTEALVGYEITPI